ncbi:MAG: NAD kinase [Nitratireductor sp.]
MKIAFVASRAIAAREALARLKKKYVHVSPAKADVIVALGGDGFMLATLHKFLPTGKPVYGMNKGTIGFLMNDYSEFGLKKRIEKSVQSDLVPLEMKAWDASGKVHVCKAFNEVSMLRQSYQAASLGISIDGKERLDALICDGIMVATPAGSTAYNLSADGPILPLDAPLLALTPVSPFRPRRWRGALLPNTSTIEIVVNEQSKRPVNAVADHVEVKSVRRISVREDNQSKAIILFDPHHTWNERILAEQFNID